MVLAIENKETRFTVNHVAGDVTYHGNIVLDGNNIIVEGNINADATVDEQVIRIATMMIQKVNPAQFGMPMKNGASTDVQVLKRVQEMKTGSLVACTAIFEMILDEVRKEITNIV